MHLSWLKILSKLFKIQDVNVTDEIDICFYSSTLSMVTWQAISVTSAYLKIFTVKSPAVTYLQKIVSETHLMRLRIFL